MPRPLSELLDLQPCGENIFRGFNQTLGGGRVFGGQVIAQALAAAGQSCPGRPCHSLHAYFLRVGDLNTPIEYAVETLHAGRSFANCRVVASQQDRPIFHLAISFQSPEEGLDFQAPMPVVVDPEALPVLADMASQHGRQRSTEEMRIDIRPVPPSVPEGGEPGRSRKYWWLRMIDPLPDTLLLHQCALAYASDFGLLGTARETHGIGFRQPGVLVASLDHAIWFHRDFRCDDWLLHAMDCPNTAGGRGFARGQIFTRTGRLIASVAQEGLVRLSA